MKPKKTQTVSVRMPSWLHKLIKELAEQEERSISQQVVYYLRQQLEEDVKKGSEKEA